MGVFDVKPRTKIGDEGVFQPAEAFSEVCFPRAKTFRKPMCLSLLGFGRVACMGGLRRDAASGKLHF
jgi:hypothetical protein